MMNSLSRRHFFQASVSLIGAFASVRGQAAASDSAPSDRLRVAIVGQSTRGKAHIEGFAADPRVDIRVVVDVESNITAIDSKFQKQQSKNCNMNNTLMMFMAALAIVALLSSSSVCSAQKCEIDWTAQSDPKNPNQNRDDTNITKFFNCQVDSQWNVAVDHAVEVIKSTGNGKKFYWIQAGPHELAYRVLTQVKRDAPGKLQNVVLVSHSGVNNVFTHSIRGSLGEGCGHTLRDCLALDDRIGYFFTSRQGGEKFGSKKADEWAAVAWMKTVDCDAWNFVDKRFRKAQEMYNKPGLDASDAGIAYTLATGDPDGNFVTLTKWIDGWCKNVAPDSTK